MVPDLLARAGVLESVAPGLEVRDIALAWEGFHEGHRSPLELRILGLRLLDETGAIRQELPDATVTLAPGWLVRGALAPVNVALQSPSIVLERAEDGTIGLAMGRHAVPEAAPAPPPGSTGEDGGAFLRRLMGQEGARGPLSALRGLDLADGSITILDRQLGLTWRLEKVAVALKRRPDGAGVQGEGSAALVLPGVGATLPVRLTASAGGDGPVVEGSISLPSLEPGRLAALLPALAPLALVDAPVALTLAGRIDGRRPGGTPELRLGLRAGRGSFTLQGHRLIFDQIALDAAGTPEALRLERLRLALAPPEGGAAGHAPVFEAEGEAARRDGRWRAALRFGLDRLHATDLNAYWPSGIVKGARGWLVNNVTTGLFRDGRFTLSAEAAEDLSGLRVTELDGTLRLEEGTVHWLRPIAPLEDVAATARFSLQEIRIEAERARQSGTALLSPGATIRFHALDTNREQAEIEARLRGPVPDAVTLIKHPRLKLFEKRPLDLKEPGGQIDGRLRLAFPLLEDIPSEVLRVNFQARLTQLRLADVVMGKTLERGTADLSVDNTRLRVSGNAELARIPTQLSVDMDFRAGPAGQVVERIQADARPDASRIAEFGLDLAGFVSGPVGVRAVMEKRRGGDTRVRLNGDLRESRMTLSPLAWRKPPGRPASAEAELRVEGDTLRAVESFRVEAPDLAARGLVRFGPNSRLELVEVEEASVFDGRFGLEARPPIGAAAPWRLRLSGAALDIGPYLAEPVPEGDGGSDGTPVAVEGNFDRVLLGGGRFLTGVQGRARADRRGVLREARFTGTAGPSGGFDVAVVPNGAGRDLRLNAADAGALLRAFDILQQVQGGRLAVNGHWARNLPDAPLTGTAEMTDFTISEAAGIGKLLQALTVYGVFEAVRGPGLSFNRMIAPFTLTRQALNLQDARAFSASLGVTAKGSILRRNGGLDLEGTIVPAYALNTLLGQIPLLGRLFSPEEGGGLFAATWRMRGPASDPAVTVNPLAALTPGFLRGLFGGLESTQPQQR